MVISHNLSNTKALLKLIWYYRFHIVRLLPLIMFNNQIPLTNTTTWFLWSTSAYNKINNHSGLVSSQLILVTFQSVYCVERKSGEKHGLPSQFQIISEMGEVSSAMLDSKVTALVNRYPDLIDFIHFSDQYSGPKQTE